MDVTANNIANVNTVGYKSERASFASMLSQTVRGASGPQAGGLGGINPTQVGLGVGAAGHPEPAHAGLAADDGPVERPGDPGRRLLRRLPDEAGRRRADRHRVHARRQLHGRRERRPRHPGRRVRARLEHGRGRTAPDVQRRPRCDQHPGRRAVGRDRRRRRRHLHQRGGPADRRPDRDRQVPEPGRPDAPLGQPVRRLAELGRVRSDQLRTTAQPRPRAPRAGAAPARTAAAESSRARSRCRTSTSRRSSPR